jgi:hypothetical protein
VGVSLFNFAGDASYSEANYGETFVRDSRIVMMYSQFSDCKADSFTGGPSSGSLGTSSVYGGAFAIIHSPQVVEYRTRILVMFFSPFAWGGFNFTVVILRSNFSECSALTNSTSVRPGTANGGGGAVYVSSIALSNLTLSDSIFSSCTVHVASGATGIPSNCSGGALAIEVPVSSDSVVAISNCSFFECLARGGGVLNMAVRGGAVAVSRAAIVSVSGSTFNKCSITDAGSSSDSSGGVVSGGAGLCVSLAQNISILSCQFDATGGQDTSQTSTGLLILVSSNTSARTHIEVSGTSMQSSSVIFSVLCVRGDGFLPHFGHCDGPDVLISDSIISQLRSQTDDRFAATGSALMTLQSRTSFSKSRMLCIIALAADPFAVFKRPTSQNPHIVEYSCRPCPTFNISMTASEVQLERLSNASGTFNVCLSSSKSSTNPRSCPFGVPTCTTFVRVTSGYWTEFVSDGLGAALRCPVGYCSCSNSINGTCPLTSLLSIDRNPDQLCSGNRTGKLCGGCPSNFTQSMDDKSCISNEICTKNLWWVWTLSILYFATYSLYIVVSCGDYDDGAISCVLFYLQMAALASNRDDLEGSSAIFEYSLVHSALGWYKNSCYAPNMRAYDHTAAKLIGPLLIFMFSVAWTCMIQALQPRLQKRNINFHVSYGGTLAATTLFVFASLSSVLFSLVECTSYTNDGVVFIDGTVPCMNTEWKVLIVTVALLCLLPVAFAAALQRNKLPLSARTAVCRSYNKRMFYWGAITLMFRLLMSLFQFLQVSFPNFLAFARSLLSAVMLVLLMHFRPHNFTHTFWVDVTCYACLIAQFGVQALQESRDYLGIINNLDENKAEFFRNLSFLSSMIR